MKRFLMPDVGFITYLDLKAEYLLSLGIKGLILDVDNTLAPYEQPTPDEALFGWLSALKEAGIETAIASNNRGGRICVFTEKLSLPVICKAKKPLPFAFKKAMAQMGTLPKETAAIGDQIFTDVLAARLAGLKCAFVVPPIKDKTDPFTRFKRLCERPVMRRFKKKGNLYDFK